MSLLLAAAGGAGGRTDVVPIRSDPATLLLLDPRVVASCEGTRLVMGTVTKHSHNPLFVADRPWENALNNLYPNVAWDEQEHGFKLWYKCVLADREVIARMMPPATVHNVGWFLLYATSPDGITWQKPDLGLIPFDGSTHTNIVARDTPNVGVFHDGHDPDPARRYKMIYDVGLGKMRVRFSADGVRWGQPLEPTGFTPYTGDTHNTAFWDERRGRYVCITRFLLGERLVARSESADFLHWEGTRLALRSSLDEGRDRQLYCMPAFPYANGYLGLVMVYNAGSDHTVDCELAWSADSVDWQRVLPGTPLIPRGPAGSYDSACIYAQAGTPVLHEGRLLLFYGGSDVVHRGWKRHCLPCLASLRPDGFAGYAPVDAGGKGMLTTGRVRLERDELRVSADAAGGCLRLSLLDDSGRPLATALPVTSNVTDAPLAWPESNPLPALRGRVLRLRAELDRAVLYAVGGVELLTGTPSGLLPPRPPPQVAAGLVERRADFAGDANGWQGTSDFTHHPAAGAERGFLRVRRADGAAFAYALATASGGHFAGDLAKTYGGAGVVIRLAVRGRGQCRQTQIELYARDIAQWRYDRLPPPAAAWTELDVALRYDWTDAEAEAAGWQPAINAFSWQETVHRVGKVVVIPLTADRPSSFDLGGFEMRTATD